MALLLRASRALRPSLRRTRLARLSMATTVAPPGGTEVHVVRAAQSARWPAETVGAIEVAAKERGARVRMYRLEDAGHWLHADNPEGLRDIVAPRLVELARAIREGEERHR